MSTNSDEDDAQVLQMLCPRGTIDDDVVEEDEHAAVKEWLENGAHKRLKNWQRVGQAERHDQELEVAMMHAKRRLVDICWVNTNLVISRAELQLGEELCAMQLV